MLGDSGESRRGNSNGGYIFIVVTIFIIFISIIIISRCSKI